LVALTFAGALLVLVLEFFEVLKCSSLLLGCRQVLHIGVVLGKQATLSQLDLALTHVVENGVDTGDDSASIIQNRVLLHVEVILDSQVSLCSVFCLVLDGDSGDDGIDGLRHHGEELLIHAEKLSKAVGLGQTNITHVGLEDRGVRLKWRPVESLFGFLVVNLFYHSLVKYFKILIARKKLQLL